MAIFEEKKTGIWSAAFLLLFLFLLIFPLWHLGDREMLGVEGQFATAVTELQWSDPAPTTHGYLFTDASPLFLIAAKLLSCLGLPMLFTLRLLSVLFYFVLTALVFFVCRRNCGTQAACAAAAVMISTVFVSDKLLYGHPETLTALLLYGGWIAWIETTLRRSNWNLAWIVAGIFGALIYCNAGITGLVYFFVPLLFQRRPLTVWPKIGHAGIYYGGLIIIGVITALWYFQNGVPPEPGSSTVDFSFCDYIIQTLVFPFYAFTRLLPWSIFLWAPFCAALIPLQYNPLFGKFHRILFLTLFVLIWFNPVSQGRDLFYLMPLIATMLGSFYWIIVRRYGFRVCRVATFCGWALLAAVTLVGLYIFLPFGIIRQGVEFFALPGNYLLTGRSESMAAIPVMAEIGVVFLFALLVLLLKNRFPCWLKVCMIFCGCVLLLVLVRAPYQRMQREKTEFAGAIQNVMSQQNIDPEQEVVFTNIKGLFAEGFYSGYRFQYTEMSRIPPEKQVIYLLTAKAPDDPNHSWSRIWSTEYKEQRLFIYKGTVYQE